MSTRRPVPDSPDQAATVPAGRVDPDPAAVVLDRAAVVMDAAADVVAPAVGAVDPAAAAAPEELSPEALDLVRRLKRVQGQVGGLVRMVEAGRTSSEIITQLSAAEHALHRVGFLLVAEEMRRCARGGGDDPEVTARIEAAEKLFLRLG